MLMVKNHHSIERRQVDAPDGGGNRRAQCQGAAILLELILCLIAPSTVAQISPLQEKALAKHKQDVAVECEKQKLIMKSPADAGKAKAEALSKCMKDAGYPIGPASAK